jgi:hypothetical protein
MDTYYIVGFIALIVATLLFVMYINVINMDLVMDDHEEKEDEDRSVEYIIMDRGQRKHKNKKNKKNHYDEKDLRVDEYDQEKYTYENRNDDPNNPYNNAYSPETIAMRQEQLKKQGDLMKKKLLTKKDDGFLDYMNDLTIKSKGLKTDAMNISNLV